MRKVSLFLVLPLAVVLFAGRAHADDNTTPQNATTQGMTAVIDIDNRPVSIAVDDLPSCVRAVASRVNSLKILYQNNFTVTDVIGECFSHDGKLVAGGRCGVKIGSGQITRLCIPDMQ
jgi:hypothetical protein